MYRWLVFLHVIGIFGFLVSHGASASVFFALRHERNLERVRLLLQLSVSSFRVMGISLLVLRREPGRESHQACQADIA